jgi:hypothetical protein
MFRAIAAFIVAPFPVALTQAIVVGVWPKVGRGVFEHPSSMFVAIALYFYIFGLLLGLPAGLFLRRRISSLRSFALLGLLVAIAPVGAALAVMTIRGQGSPYVLAYTLTLFSLGGLAAGALFWRLAIWKKRDESAAKAFA